MAEAEIVLRTKILLKNKVQPACIGIDNGKIFAVKKILSGEKNYDFSTFLALPGGVDTHTHMRDPGITQKEDFYTGTLSAAFGGTTTILDMPNTKPMVLTTKHLEEKIEIVKNKANVDYGFFCVLSYLDSMEPLEKILRLAAGLKLYMAETTGALGTPDESLETLVGAKALTGKVITVHAEDSSRFLCIKCNDLKMHNINRNMESEISAVQKVLAVKTQATVNLAHLTAVESLELARASNTRFEITPQHFLLHDASGIGPFGKVNPPLRHKEIAARLFEEVRGGKVDIIASDHAPHTFEEKSVGFDEAPSGMPGVETRLPLMMALAKRNKVSLGTVQTSCCQNPAELFDMKKGKIDTGYDADISFFDMSQVEKINGEKLHSKCGWSAFDGFEAIFPAAVMLRGQWVVKDRELEEDKLGIMLGQPVQGI